MGFLNDPCIPTAMDFAMAFVFSLYPRKWTTVDPEWLKHWKHVIHDIAGLKRNMIWRYNLPKTNTAPENHSLEDKCSFWDGLFSGVMLGNVFFHYTLKVNTSCVVKFGFDRWLVVGVDRHDIFSVSVFWMYPRIVGDLLTLSISNMAGSKKENWFEDVCFLRSVKLRILQLFSKPQGKEVGAFCSWLSWHQLPKHLPKWGWKLDFQDTSTGKEAQQLDDLLRCFEAFPWFRGGQFQVNQPVHTCMSWDTSGKLPFPFRMRVYYTLRIHTLP